MSTCRLAWLMKISFNCLRVLFCCLIQSTKSFCNEDFDVFLDRTGIQRSDLWDETVVCSHTFFLLFSGSFNDQKNFN